jgi:hypothetical protein
MTHRPITDARLKTFSRIQADMMATGQPACWIDAIDDLITERTRLLDELATGIKNHQAAESELTGALVDIVATLEPSMQTCRCDAHEDCDLPLAAAGAHRIAREVLTA